MNGNPLDLSAATAAVGLRGALILHLAALGESAGTVLQDVLTVEPRLGELPLTAGVMLMGSGQHAQALSFLEQAVTIDFRDVAALNALAVARLALGREPTAALEAIDTALAAMPAYAEGWQTKALILEHAGEQEAALAAADRALAIEPNYLEALNGRGVILARLARPDEAIASYDRALQLRPDFPEAYNNRAVALEATDRWREAIDSCDRALALRPDYAEAHCNRGNLLRHRNQHAESLASLDRALALQPEMPAFLCNRGFTLVELGRFGEALEDYRRALRIQPDYAEAHYGIGVVLLAWGELAAGWREYEWRWVRRRLPQPQWDGTAPLEGRTILLRHEQGMGDTLQFCRYVPLVAERGARVLLQAPAALCRLLRTLRGDIEVIESGSAVPEFDFHCALPSLPMAFGTTLQTIPADVPYLHADPDAIAMWRDRLSELPGLRVGLVWAGNPRPDAAPEIKAIDRRRSIALAQYAHLGWVAGVSLVSLQKDAAASQTRSPPPGMQIYDPTDELTDFADTAALVEALDLVITVDTAVAHLAGALGKPVWILNRSDACWRWMLNRSDSPWYPTARLFRQATPGDWDAVIADVATALGELAG